MRNLIANRMVIESTSLFVVRHESANAELSFNVRGIIANSVPTSETGKRRLVAWKRQVLSTTRHKRGEDPWDPLDLYAISIGFSFHAASHGNRQLDIENFLKPTIDALAAGLFSSQSVDPQSISRFDYDDSNFVHLFIERLPDVLSPEEERVTIHISAVSDS